MTRLGYPLTQGVLDPGAVRTVDGVPYHRAIPWLPPAGPVRAVDRGARHAARLAAELRAGVLHAASNHLNGAVALAAGRRAGLPVVYEVRGFLEDSWLSRDPAHRPDAEFYRLTRAAETRCMRAADLVVTLGEAMREEIAARGVDRIVVVPNAVDPGFLEPLPDGGALRARLGLHSETFVVGLTSTLYGYEGVDTLIEAVGLLRGRGLPVTLLVVGDGPARPALERRAAALAPAAAPDPAVLFTGRVPLARVREYHSLLDVFAVPRRADRVCRLVTPLKPLEAMAGGIPVIASDVNALREIVEPDVTGRLIPPQDPVSWADCLTGLVYSPELRRKLGQAGRDWVRGSRTWPAVTRRYLAAYRDLGVG